jgi:hypothetical protein
MKKRRKTNMELFVSNADAPSHHWFFSVDGLLGKEAKAASKRLASSCSQMEAFVF